MPSVRRMFAIATAATLFTVLAPLSALGESESQRSAHWSVGVGASAMLTGSESSGSIVDAEVYPGGRFGRIGARVEGRGLGQLAANVFLGGVSFEAATARPRLVLALYVSVGANSSGQPAVAAGVRTQLAVVGPLALGLDAGGLLIIDGTADTELYLGSALSIRLAR